MSRLTKEDLERMRSIGFNRRGPSSRVREFRTGTDQHRAKATTDELGNTTTEHDTKDDRVDVVIRPSTIQVKGKN